jgi:hypothetical protein
MSVIAWECNSSSTFYTRVYEPRTVVGDMAHKQSRAHSELIIANTLRLVLQQAR